MDRIEKASHNKGNVTGVATGFIDLDYKTAGMQPSDLILIAARPSMGKTAFVLNNQTAECRFFRYDIGIILYVGGSRHRRDQIPDKFQTADLRRHIFLLQPVLERHQINWFPFIIEFNHRLKEDAILLTVKIISRNNFRGRSGKIYTPPFD
mgnify:CR=1 FL=1